MRLKSTERDNLKTRYVVDLGTKAKFYYPDCPISGGDIVKVTFHTSHMLIVVKRGCLKEKLKFRVETLENVITFKPSDGH